MKNSSTKDRIDNIQALRGVAALIVVFFHTNQIFSAGKYFNSVVMDGFWSWGTHGVDLFFVISGFIMAYVHYDDFMNRCGASRFLISRFSRIYVPYWPVLSVLVLMYFLIPALGVESGRNPRDPALIIKSFLLLPSYTRVMSVAWTLGHEITFYFIIFIVLSKRNIGIALFIAWQVAALIISLTVSDVHAISYSPFSPFAVEFLFGIVALLITKHIQSVKYPILIMIFGIAIFLVLGLYESYVQAVPLNGSGYARTLSYGLASTVIVAGAVYCERSRTLCMPSILPFIGGASYSIYIIHYDFLFLAAKISRAIGFATPQLANVGFVFWSAAAVTIGILYHLIVERPLTQFVRNWLSAVFLKRPRAGAHNH